MRWGAGFIVLAALAGCSRGEQKLYVVNDTGQPVDISVGGKKMDRSADDFTVYFDLNLKNGAALEASQAGVSVDHVDLPPVEDGKHVVWIVRGSDNVHLADYKALATVGRKESRLVGFSASDISLIDPTPPDRWVAIPAQAEIVGPSAKLPAGGKVTGAGEKLPILRVERVPPNVGDVRAYLAEKVNDELAHAPK